MHFSCVCLDHVFDRLKNDRSSATDVLSSTIDRFKVLMRLQHIEAATLQCNFSVALNLLKNTHKV